MGTTASGIPYPEPADPVAAGAQNMRALAEKVPYVQSGTTTVVLTNVITGSVTVTYPKAFARAPRVSAIVAGTSGFFTYLASTPAASSFIVGVRQYKDTVTTANVSVQWIAADPVGSV